MMIITFGLYGDTLSKIFIVNSEYTKIDIKCQLAIFSRVVFHYIAYFFIIIRIDRVKQFYKIMKEVLENKIVHDQQDTGSAHQSNLKRKFFMNITREARMQREERVITNTCVNIIVPLALLGLSANFIPYLLLVVPLEEQDTCWFYFITRSPFTIDEIQNWLFMTSWASRFIITIIEILILGYYFWQINSFNMISSINIKRESQILVGQWILLSLIIAVLKFFINPDMNSDDLSLKRLQLAVFAIHLIRNMLAAVIPCFFSILMVVNNPVT